MVLLGTNTELDKHQAVSKELITREDSSSREEKPHFQVAASPSGGRRQSRRLALSSRALTFRHNSHSPEENRQEGRGVGVRVFQTKPKFPTARPEVELFLEYPIPGKKEAQGEASATIWSPTDLARNTQQQCWPLIQWPLMARR